MKSKRISLNKNEAMALLRLINGIHSISLNVGELGMEETEKLRNRIKKLAYSFPD